MNYKNESDTNIKVIADFCIKYRINPRESVKDRLTCKKVLRKLDEWVEDGTIEDKVTSLNEIMQVIEWIAG